MSSRVILLAGLPRSGKSTYSREQVEKGSIPSAAIVNPDSIRLAIHGRLHYPQADQFVWYVAKIMTKALFLAGHENVIVDATAITRWQRDSWRKEMLFSDLKDFSVEIVHINTSKEECIRRAVDSNQKHMIPVIEKMAEDFEPFDEDENVVLTIRG